MRDAYQARHWDNEVDYPTHDEMLTEGWALDGAGVYVPLGGSEYDAEAYMARAREAADPLPF